MSHERGSLSITEPLKFVKDPNTGIFTASAPITRVEEFVALVSRLGRDQNQNVQSRPPLFRGQMKLSDDLLPQLARERQFRFSLQDESHLLQEFKRLSPPHIRGSTQDLTDLEWLALAQHHGMPTRLLDWTDSALAALWFCTNRFYDRNNLIQKKPQGVVWVYLPEDDEFLNPREQRQSPFEFKKTKVFRPKHFADRIRAQSGWFTVHSYQPRKGRFLAMNSRDSCKTRLRCIPVEGSRFPSISRQLALCGVTSATIFPDLTGLCGFLATKVRHEYELRSPRTK